MATVRDGPAWTRVRARRPAVGATPSIRNMFIIPTVAFLIVFNIFPLIYSLGYSFTDFRASLNAPANFVGLRNYSRAVERPASSGTISGSRRNT